VSKCRAETSTRISGGRIDTTATSSRASRCVIGNRLRALRLVCEPATSRFVELTMFAGLRIMRSHARVRLDWTATFLEP
jgi:hypothetical protein